MKSKYILWALLGGWFVKSQIDTISNNITFSVRNLKFGKISKGYLPIDLTLRVFNKNMQNFTIERINGFLMAKDIRISAFQLTEPIVLLPAKLVQRETKVIEPYRTDVALTLKINLFSLGELGTRLLKLLVQGQENDS